MYPAVSLDILPTAWRSDGGRTPLPLFWVARSVGVSRCLERARSGYLGVESQIVTQVLAICKRDNGQTLEYGMPKEPPELGRICYEGDQPRSQQEHLYLRWVNCTPLTTAHALTPVAAFHGWRCERHFSLSYLWNSRRRRSERCCPPCAPPA